MATRRGASGFTLIELMVTVVILSILAVVAVASYGKFKRSARQTEGISAVNDIRMKQETFYNTYSRYVSTTADEDTYDGALTATGDLQGLVTWDVVCPDPTNGWCNLGFRPPLTRIDATTEVGYFRYNTMGWAPGVTAPSMITDASQRWLAIQAIGLAEYNGSTEACTRLQWTNESNDVLVFPREGSCGN
jgi:prepilin-type N-terminal cleavage/methylation domain-containing protein